MSDNDEECTEQDLRDYAALLLQVDRYLTAVVSDTQNRGLVDKFKDDSTGLMGLAVMMSEHMAEKPDFNTLASEMIAVAILKLAGFDVARLLG